MTASSSPTRRVCSAFGTGSHYCLGANLARMTLMEAVRGLVENPADPSVDLADIPRLELACSRDEGAVECRLPGIRPRDPLKHG